MASIRTWSTSAASNNQATPDGFPEGMAPSTLNDSNRELMASVRTWYQDAQWIDWGHAPTRVSDTQFSVATDQTAVYTVSRRVRVVGATTGYGTISASSYGAPNTTITVTWDSGVTPTSPTTVSVGLLTPSNNSLPAATINNSNWSGTDLAVVNGGTGASTVAAALLNFGIEQKYKSADESVTASTTLQDDDHLTGFALVTSGYYEIDGYLELDGPVGAVSAVLFPVFTNAPQAYSFSSVSDDGAAARVSTTTSTATGVSGLVQGTGTASGVRLSGFAQANATTGGTVKLQWAQQVSDATALVMRKGSWMRFTRLD